DQVLASSPNHLLALANKGVCLWRVGDVAQALEITFKCIELEPNETLTYRNAATFLTGVGRPEAAIQLLKQSLDRYRAEYKTWVMLLRIAAEYDLLDQVEELVEAGMKLIGDAKIAATFRAWIVPSRVRARRYASSMKSATDAQLAGAWTDAMQHLDDTI